MRARVRAWINSATDINDSFHCIIVVGPGTPLNPRSGLVRMLKRVRGSRSVRWGANEVVYGDAMSSFDHYATARELISHLERTGYPTEAAALDSAMADGATGTEIFMALRFHLASIITRIPLKGDAQLLASRLLAELDDALE